MTLRFAVAWVILAASLGFVFGGTLVDWSLSRPPYAQEQPGSQSQNNETAKNNDPSAFFAVGAWAKDNAAAIGALSAIGVLVFTVVLAVSTILLWDATKKLWGASERTAQRQLRAYLVIETARVYSEGTEGKRQPLTAGRSPQFMLKIRNTGQTPATHIRQSVEMQLRPWPLDESRLRRLKNLDIEQGFSLGAGRAWKIRSLDERVLAAEHQTQLEWGHEVGMFVHGEIRYRDVFGKKRWTKFRLFVTGADAIARMHLVPHDAGNEADHDQT